MFAFARDHQPCIIFMDEIDAIGKDILLKQTSTVQPAKSDSDLMFCLRSYQGLIIDISLVKYQFALAQVKCTC